MKLQIDQTANVLFAAAVLAVAFFLARQGGLFRPSSSAQNAARQQCRSARRSASTAIRAPRPATRSYPLRMIWRSRPKVCGDRELSGRQ